MKNKVRLDYIKIAGIIARGAKVLDLGCGTGGLMLYLETQRQADTQGIEINEEAIYKCVEKGLTVFHSDIGGGLSIYPDGSFDYVILNQSLQQVKRVDYVIEEALRVGKKVIIGFPNFAYITARLMLFFKGIAPVVKSMPDSWDTTENIRFLSIKDFKSFCRRKKYKISEQIFIGDKAPAKFMPNLLAKKAIFAIEAKSTPISKEK